MALRTTLPGWLLCALVAVTSSLTADEMAVFYNNATLEVEGDKYEFESSGMPDHDTTLTVQDGDYTWMIPVTPVDLDTPGCLPLGPIGFAVNGVPFFNPYTEDGYNAVEGDNAVAVDSCDGSVTEDNLYHYRTMSSCLMEILFNGSITGERLFGVALDGYPIYGEYTADTADLDDCHGKEVDGQYRYYITSTFPYVLGCFKGEITVPASEEEDEEEAGDDNDDDDDDDDDTEETTEETTTGETETGTDESGTEESGTESNDTEEDDDEEEATSAPQPICLYANVSSPNGLDDISQGTYPDAEPAVGAAGHLILSLAAMVVAALFSHFH